MSTNAMSTLRSILVEDFGISGHCINEETLLRRDLQLDSTETVGVALELKHRLGISVKLESGKDLSLSEVCAMIDEALGANSVIQRL